MSDVFRMFNEGWYNRDGEEIDAATASMLRMDMSYKRVALTSVGNYEVSTVWLGYDHDWGREGPPLIFETMVFHRGGEDGSGWLDDDCQRYSTEEQARQGHEDLVFLIKVTQDIQVE